MHVDELVALLDSDAAAQRRAPGLPVWEAQRRALDPWHRLRGQPPREADALLARVLASFTSSGAACYLETGEAVTPDELGTGSWRALAHGRWQATAALSVEAAASSHLLSSLGNYVLYVPHGPEPVGLPFALPWLDAGASEELLRGIQASGIAAALWVHPDASDWLVVIPDPPLDGHHLT